MKNTQLHNSDIHSDASPLNPPFYIAGTVEKGDGRGTKIGFPTINLDVKNIGVPHGVYVVLARCSQEVMKGVAHIGVPKTFNLTQATCEVHLFNCDENLYDKRVELNLLHYLREVQKFENQEALVIQIKKDVEIAQRFLKNV